MKRNLVCLLVVIYSSSIYPQIKQLTFGNNDEFNPSLSRNVSFAQFEWLAYERQTQDSSFIVVKKFLRTTDSWDSSEIIISKSNKNEIQKYPEVCCKRNYSIVGWQKKYQGKWNIFYSKYSFADSQWSPPIQLTNDTLNNVNVRIQSIYPDSQFIFTWQNKKIIRYNVYPVRTIGIKDTIAISNYDSIEYDLGTDGAYFGSVIFTIKGASNKYGAVVRDFNFYPKDSLYAYDTLQLNLSLRNPKFLQYYTPNKKIVFETPRLIDSLNDLYIYNIRSPFIIPSQPFKITNSDNSHYNARVFFFPIITSQTNQSATDVTPYNCLAVYQASKNITSSSNRDSSLVRITNSFTTDTIQSPGFNRNPIIGSFIVSGERNNGIYTLVVWESNRTGYTHLYSKKSLVGIVDEVPSSEKIVHSFILLQNYPNPFNSSSIIKYQIPVNSYVTLKVYDVLGKEVATLVNEIKTAGSYTVKFSAKGGSASGGDAGLLNSGMYFYTIKAGAYKSTRKMLLMK